MRFLLNGEEQAVKLTDPTLTVLDYLRLERRLTGAKEGCAEGDCGACTVLVGKLDGDAVRYEAVNACIRLMATMDRRALVTVESLKAADGALHPVQQDMVGLHGSQCGFCTPGIVMSLLALWLNSPAPPSRARIEDALAGNLCRCTGYGPIVAALGRAYETADPAEDALRAGEAQVAAQLKAMAALETLSFTADGLAYIAPRTVEELAAAYAAQPDATIVAGATDVGLWVTKEMRRLQTVITVGDVAGFQTIKREGDVLVLGAGASLSACHRALGKLHPQVAEMLRRFGSEQVRNMGTIGGSLANGSPIGDLAPVLIAMGARLQLRKGGERREIPLEGFFIDYKKQDRAPGEFVEGVSVPDLPANALLHVSKVSKRLDEDITSTLGAFFLLRDGAGVVTEARLAFGGMAATPKRARNAEAALVGRPFNAVSAQDAANALAKDFSPLDDWRASARYRAQVAANLLIRFAAETEAGATLRVTGPLPEMADA